MTDYNLLPTGCEERGVLGVGSISGAILTSCQDVKIIVLQLHKKNIELGNKNNKRLRGSVRSIQLI